MLSEFKCRKCQAKFLVGLRDLNAPIKRCVCCGGDDLEYIGSVRPQDVDKRQAAWEAYKKVEQPTREAYEKAIQPGG